MMTLRSVEESSHPKPGSPGGHVLVTGATGFLGRHVVRALLELGAEVTATARDATKAREMEWYSLVRFIPFDLADSAAGLFDHFGRPERCLHLAWGGLPNYRDIFHLKTNLPLHRAFLDHLLGEGLRHLLVAGTCLEYGLRGGCLTEDMDPAPDNPYAQAKDQLRRHLESVARRTGASLRWVRLFYLFGPGQNPRSLLAQLDRAIDDGWESFDMSGGQQSRDYLPVQTAAAYLAHLVLQDDVTGILNCCSGRPITVENLVREHMLRRGADLRLNLGVHPSPEWEPMHFWGADTKLKKALAVHV